MRINQFLSHAKSYDDIYREIIKHLVKRNIEGFSTHADDNMPQDILKGTNEILEHKPSLILKLDKDDSTSTDVSEYDTIATKDNVEFNNDRLNKKEDIKIKETQKDADNSISDTNEINTYQKHL